MAERKGAARGAGGKAAAKTAAAAKPRKVKPTKAKRDSATSRKNRAAEREAKRQAAEMALAKDGLEAKPKTGAAATVENAATYLAIFKDWCKGMTLEAISANHGLGIRRCQQIVGELRDARVAALQINDPLFGLRLAHDLLLHHRAAISEYAELAEGAGTQASVKIAALRERDRAQDAFKTLAQELGLVPRHLGTLRVQEDFLALVDALLDEMDKQKLSLEVQRALVEAVEMRASTGKDGRLRITAGGVDGEAVEDAEVVDAAA